MNRKFLSSAVLATFFSATLAGCDSFGAPSEAASQAAASQPAQSSARNALTSDFTRIEPGDVILAWNGDAIGESSSLPVLVAKTAPGKSARLRIWRDGAERTLNVTVGSMPGEEQVASAAGSAAGAARLGLSVRPLDANGRAQLNAANGLLVENASGAAADAGVRGGDVILAVNGHPVRNVEQLRSLVEKAGKHVALLVQREDAKLFLPVEIG